MKKILATLVLFSALTSNALNVDSLNYQETLKIDTTIVLTHPTTNDSIKVVKIVNGVVKIASVFVDEPITNTLLNSPYTSGGLVALILGIWRRIEKRKLRKKGLLKDK